MSERQPPPKAEDLSPTKLVGLRCCDATGAFVDSTAHLTRSNAIRLVRQIAEEWDVDLQEVLEPSRKHVTERERDRLRDLLDKVHAQLHDALNATPLDSPDGTASGFEHELMRGMLARLIERKR